MRIERAGLVLDNSFDHDDELSVVFDHWDAFEYLERNEVRTLRDHLSRVLGDQEVRTPNGEGEPVTWFVPQAAMRAFGQSVAEGGQP